MGGVILGILRSSVLCQFLNFNVSVQNEDALPDVLQMQFVSAQYEGSEQRTKQIKEFQKNNLLCLPVCSVVQNKLFFISLN